MLAYEKFLCEKKASCNFPVPWEKGFFAYNQKIKNIRTINFLFFDIETAKNSLSTYNFKFTTVEMCPAKTKNNIDYKVTEVDWENFFSSIDEIVEKMKSADSISVAKTVDEADHLIWKSFVVTNDEWFSECFSSLPASFFESLDESKSSAYMLEQKNIFIKYLKENHSSLHSRWTSYFQREYCDYFCDWFYNYFMDKNLEKMVSHEFS